MSVSLTLEQVKDRARRAPMVPIFRDMLSDALTPVTAFAALAADGPAYLLESVERGEQLGRYSFVAADPMASVHGALNAVALDAAYAGSLVFQGPGAGPVAAASAVLADLVRAAKGVPSSAGALLASLADTPSATVAPLGPKNPYPAAS